MVLLFSSGLETSSLLSSFQHIPHHFSILNPLRQSLAYLTVNPLNLNVPQIFSFLILSIFVTASDNHSFFNSANSSSASWLFVNVTSSKPCNILVTLLSLKVSPSLLYLPFYRKALLSLSSIHSCLHSLPTTPQHPNTILTNNTSPQHNTNITSHIATPHHDTTKHLPVHHITQPQPKATPHHITQTRFVTQHLTHHIKTSSRHTPRQGLSVSYHSITQHHNIPTSNRESRAERKEDVAVATKDRES